MTDHPALRRVRILDFPLEPYERARRHQEALMREFAILAEEDADAHRVPRRLVEIMDGLRQRYSGLNDEAEDAIEDAIARGEASIDLVLDVPEEVAQIAAELAVLLDDADDFCRSGDLLTLATPADVRALRTWYLTELVAQLGGAAPTPWPGWSLDGEQVAEAGDLQDAHHPKRR